MQINSLLHILLLFFATPCLWSRVILKHRNVYRYVINDFYNIGLLCTLMHVYGTYSIYKRIR